MASEIRTATTQDIESLRSYVDSLSTEAVIDVAFVTDANHNDSSRNDLSIGSIKGKSDKLAGRNEAVDFTYSPIDSNLRKYPIPGEYVLVIRSSMGNFYITSLNINNNVNNNIDTSKVTGYTKYNEEEYNTSSPIKRSKQIRTSDKITDDKFQVRTIPTRELKYGDVIHQGKYGNSILFSYTDNQEPRFLIENNGSAIEMFDSVGDYQRLTNTTYNSVLEKQFNNKNGNHLTLSSERLILRSFTNGIFLESVGNSIGLVSDKDIDISAGRQLSINGNIILIGTESNDEPLVRGREFSKQWVTLIQLLHEVANSMKGQSDIPFLKGIGSLITDKLNIGIAGEGVNNIQAQSLTKLLSEEVFIR